MFLLRSYSPLLHSDSSLLLPSGLDNMAVVQGTKGSHAEEHDEDAGSLKTMCWVGFTDPYRWCELQAVARDMHEVGTQVEAVWSKGHPEK